jgi:hypothetical protein
MIHAQIRVICDARDGDDLCGNRVVAFTRPGETPTDVTARAIREAHTAGWTNHSGRWTCPRRHAPAVRAAQA